METLVLKLVDKKHLNSFLRYGELHFGSTDSYREIEEINGNIGIGDRNEGVFNPAVKYTGFYPHKTLLGLPNNVSLKYPANIFCVVQIHPGIETDSRIKRDVIINLYDSLMSDTQYEKTIVGFKNFNIVSDRIVQRLNKFYANGPLRQLRGPIHYVERGYMAEEAQNIAMTSEFSGIQPRIGSVLAANLVKENKFLGEYEYRFILFPTEGGLKILKRSHNNIRIGDLRKQTIVIGDSIEDLINAVEISFNTKVD
ncbi:hypothetical protein [Lactiplantibacillus herbarum]|uniref:hypothetical protein n=1 Tax=Lactiplantibacillus herbarum TaxID=1670446 RepID=UPI00064F2071|nr:hypothetical protein [Lactiplantibacillus herbarum]